MAFAPSFSPILHQPIFKTSICTADTNQDQGSDALPLYNIFMACHAYAVVHGMRNQAVSLPTRSQLNSLSQNMSWGQFLLH